MTVHRLENRRRKKAIFKDFFPICFIALFGSFGFAYIFNTDCIFEYNTESSTSKVSLATHSLSLSPFLNTKKHPFTIEGNYFSNQVLQFNLNNYNPAAEYSMQLGNGESINIITSNFEYSFVQPGEYKLSLISKFPNQRVKVWSKNVMIEDENTLIYNTKNDNF